MSIALLALLAGGQASSPPPAPAAPTMQQRFDAASDAAAEGRCEEAIAGFEQIEAIGTKRPNPLLKSAMEVRKGRCLIRMNRIEEGVAAVRRGIPLLESKGADFADDVRAARLSLGDAAYVRTEYDLATKEYQSALDLSQGVGRIAPLIRIAQVTMFDHDGKALAAADEARTLALSLPKPDKKLIADVQTRYARVLLNEGRKEEAYKVLKDSLKKQGGLDTTVNISDIATRSDLAIAALQNNDKDSARQYLAYTGAGRLENSPFTRSAAMDPPLCGGDAALKPEDIAIVEFSLEEDGSVSGVSPIYTTGGRKAAIAFASAVSGWSWQPEVAKKIPVVFRYTTRVEMRCIKTPDAPRLTQPLAEEVDEWLATKIADAPAWTDMSAASARPLQLATIERARASGNDAELLRAALALSQNPARNLDENSALLKTAAAAADRLGAPPAVGTFILVSQSYDNPPEYIKAVCARLSDPSVTSDPISAATLRLLITQPGPKKSPPKDAPQLLEAVLAEPALPEKHPLKIAALLQKANLFAAKGDVISAQTAFKQTGLSAEQCALIGIQPALRRDGTGSDSFPQEAQALGFEGWVRTEFDIAADGRTIAQRAVTSYPPFIFDEAALKILSGARFASSFRPEGGLACSGQRLGVSFRIP